MDTAVAIRTLEATYKQSADSIAVESMIAKLTEKVVFSRLYKIYTTTTTKPFNPKQVGVG